MHCCYSLGRQCEDLSRLENFLCSIFNYNVLTLEVCQFYALYSFVCGDEVFWVCQFADRIWQITDISNSATRARVDL